jgi:FkbM family methyltransferase
MIRAPWEWQPPFPQKLRACPADKSMCRAYLLLSNQSGGDRAAWQELHAYYTVQLQKVPDARSRITIKYLLDVSYYYYHSSHQIPERYFDIGLAESSHFMAEVPALQRRFPWIRRFKRHHHMEAFYYAHGLRFCSPSIRAYVRNRDFIDCGAYTGDSLAALDEYTTKRIVSYEIFANYWKIAESVGRRFANGKHLVFYKGLGKENSIAYIQEEGSGPAGLWNSNGTTPVIITTLDDEVKRLGLDVGFIKADIEGEEFNFLLGAVQTLRDHHPVVNIAIYHTADLLNVPKWFDALGGFILTFHTENDGMYDNLNDLRLFAIPYSMNAVA